MNYTPEMLLSYLCKRLICNFKITVVLFNLFLTNGHKHMSNSLAIYLTNYKSVFKSPLYMIEELLFCKIRHLFTNSNFSF